MGFILIALSITSLVSLIYSVIHLDHLWSFIFFLLLIMSTAMLAFMLIVKDIKPKYKFKSRPLDNYRPTKIEVTNENRRN